MTSQSCFNCDLKCKSNPVNYLMKPSQTFYTPVTTRPELICSCCKTTAVTAVWYDAMRQTWSQAAWLLGIWLCGCVYGARVEISDYTHANTHSLRFCSHSACHVHSLHPLLFILGSPYHQAGD